MPARLFRLVRPSTLWITSWIVGLLALAALAAPAAAGDKPLGFADLMRFRTLQEATIAEHGDWVAYALVPDRGDGELVVRATGGDAEYRVARGRGPQISSDSRFVAALVEPTLEARERAKDEQDEAKKPKSELVLLATADGAEIRFQRVRSFAFSTDGRWLAIHHEPEEKSDQPELPPIEPAALPAGQAAAAEEPAEEPETPPEGVPQPAVPEPGPEPEPAARPSGAEASLAESEKPADERLGSTLVLHRLDDGHQLSISHVESWAFDESARFIAYAVAAPGGGGNALLVRDLVAVESPARVVTASARGRYGSLTWSRQASRLGFVAAVDDEDGEPGDGSLWIWDGGTRAGRPAVTSNEAPAGWFVPSVNELVWSRDGERLFFGYKPIDEKIEKKEAEKNAETDAEAPFEPYDFEAILADRGVDVWHWNDPLIVPNQKKQWAETEKDRTYRAVYHVADARAVPLADRTMRGVDVVDNPRATLGQADVPYLREITWDGWYYDLYWVSLADGERRKVIEQLRNLNEPSLSPDGRFVAYYHEPHWYLWNAASGTARNLTAGLAVSFADEDHDYPQPAPGYNVADWLEDGSAVLIYDKYDIWRFPTDGGEATNLTAGVGRREETIFRLVDLDDERDSVRPGEQLLLHGYRDRTKNDGFWQATEGVEGVRSLIEEERRLRFVARAKEADRLLFTRERYDEFPDLWIADLELGSSVRLSDANPQIADYAWGQAELVEWQSADGIPLQGVLIRPGGYRPGERYPVLVYFYRFFSQRLHEFNEPVINHRPSFPVYASHGYAIFLPDVRFEVGRPGLAAVKSLVPGVQKLVEMGVADPERIGLHGHSWSGYQTAFIVTQTNLFAAAVAGAPVSNMTSAYGGIRWGTGLARQFQYEMSQSRLGASLWQARDLYVENSPLFYADRIETPLLLMFGDEDEAVPWYQGIELYLALRRLGKEAVFLQYRGEGHHPKQYPNKLDYSIKMKEFFDHFLQGAPAPGWWTEGVAYRGE